MLRESIQGKSGERKGDSREEREKLEAKVASLEAYIHSLEQRIPSSPSPSYLLDSHLSELSSLRQTVTALSQENQSLHCKLESLSLALNLAEKRTTDHSSCLLKIQELETTIHKLRSEIQTQSTRNQSQVDIIPYQIEEKSVKFGGSLNRSSNGEVDFLTSQLEIFMKESEEKQEELKRRIAILESRKRSRKKSKPKPSLERDLSEPRKSSCERCSRHHSKEASTSYS